MPAALDPVGSDEYAESFNIRSEAVSVRLPVGAQEVAMTPNGIPRPLRAAGGPFKSVIFPDSPWPVAALFLGRLLDLSWLTSVMQLDAVGDGRKMRRVSEDH